MKIRRAEKEDAAEWCRMRHALWPDEAGRHADDIEAYFADPNAPLATFVAAADDGTLRGFLEAGTRPYAENCQSSPVGFIEGWWVDPGVRRQGIGRALVAAAETWARDLGLSEMASDALIDNRLSHMAHRALGYEETERIVCFRRSLLGDET